MKKILTVSYYSDFSRFFKLGIENMLRDDVSWLNLCIYPSAYIYSISHNIKSVFLPSKVNNKAGYELDINSDTLNDLCRYHGVNKSSIERTKAYLAYYERLLKEYNPDLIILSGDSRIPVTTLSYVAKSLGIKVVYFEQGPLNTTILDQRGVNANCSFRFNDHVSDDSSAFDQAKSVKVKKWSGYKKYRYLDILYGFLPFKNVAELSRYKLPNIRRKNKRYPQSKVFNYCLLILQVPEDANMILHSPYFDNHSDIVKTVHKSLPDGIKLVVREHPLYIGKYENDLYEYIDSNDIIIDSKSPLLNDINNSEFVVVNNSTVGLETLYLGKKLIVLGDSYYDNCKFVSKYDGGNLRQLIDFTLEHNIDEDNIKKRINYFFNSCFISGHFRDYDHDRFKRIGEVISEYLA